MLIILKRYFFSTVGLFFVALGTALSANVNLGVAPLSSFAYVLFFKYQSITFGTFIFIVNLVYVLFQLMFYGKAFKLKYLLQLVASLVFSFFVDLSGSLLTWIPNTSLITRLLITILASLVTAIGISMEVKSNAWMLGAETTIAAFCYRFPKSSFSTVKVYMDCIWVVLTAILAFIFFGNPIGTGELTNIGDQLLAKIPGTVVGLGTIILAILPGYLVRYTDLLFKNIRL